MRIVFLLLLAAGMTHTAMAQRHLTPESREYRKDKYHTLLRTAFSRARDKDVVLSVLVVPSFGPEEAAGILKTARGDEAFAITPSASIHSTEYYRLTRVYGIDGKRIRQESPEQRAKHGVPENYRQITLRIQSRLLNPKIAARIGNVWQRMLLDALHPSPPNDEEQMVCDGVSFHFSMPLAGHGLVTAQGHPYENNSLVRRMGKLAFILAEYARGRATTKELGQAL